MRRLFLSILAVGLSLSLAGAANAGGKHGSSSHSSSGNSKSYSMHHESHEHHGSSMKSYKKDHFYWSSRIWYPKYGCYCYWEPTYACYYYWCVPDACYYPVSYCPYGKYCW